MFLVVTVFKELLFRAGLTKAGLTKSNNPTCFVNPITFQSNSEHTHTSGYVCSKAIAVCGFQNFYCHLLVFCLCGFHGVLTII